MYDPIIETTYGTIYKTLTDQCGEKFYEAVCRVGINVKKEELLKALAYDRDQYEKGYADGKAASETEEIQELREQADIDKMQIALYDKENKELRKQLRELQEVMKKIHILSLNPEVTREIPNKTIFEKSNDIVWCECNNFWRDYLENGNS